MTNILKIRYKYYFTRVLTVGGTLRPRQARRERQALRGHLEVMPESSGLAMTILLQSDREWVLCSVFSGLQGPGGTIINHSEHILPRKNKQIGRNGKQENSEQTEIQKSPRKQYIWETQE